MCERASARDLLHPIFHGEGAMRCESRGHVQMGGQRSTRLRKDRDSLLNRSPSAGPTVQTEKQ